MSGVLGLHLSLYNPCTLFLANLEHPKVKVSWAAGGVKTSLADLYIYKRG